MCRDAEYIENELLRAEAIDERALIRVNDKAYVGGMNSAESSHYEYPIAVDFCSFYPSIGCQFGLSMETAVIMTAQRFVTNFSAFDSKKQIFSVDAIDNAIKIGMLRVFDYEPPENVNYCEAENNILDAGCNMPKYTVRTRYGGAAEGKYILHGRDDVAAGTLLKNNGWYEGVEFNNVREILESSESATKRRVLVVYCPRPNYTPIIAGLWTHYLTARKYYKTLIRENKTNNTVGKIRVYECMEKMYKVVANSLYGYLNYDRSVVYAPTVAAAVTLLSRKTFCETTWLCENLFPKKIASRYSNTRCRVVYRDTDGLVLHIAQSYSSVDVTAAERKNMIDDKRRRQRQQDYESIVVRTINDSMLSRGYRSIIIELDDQDLRLCSIMGKKKYWKFSCDAKKSNIVTKGFEKNAQTYVKHLVRVLQTNVLRYVRHLSSSLSPSCDSSFEGGAFRLIVEDVGSFFGAIFSSLRRYETLHDINSFTFGIKLNPRSTDGVEARFIQQTLTNYNFTIGERVQCLFVLDKRDPGATVFKIARDFARNDRINYYKLIRRIAVYLLQLVEGFKRSEATNDRTYYMNASNFDTVLKNSYCKWLTLEGNYGDEYEELLDENVKIADIFSQEEKEEENYRTSKEKEKTQHRRLSRLQNVLRVIQIDKFCNDTTGTTT